MKSRLLAAFSLGALVAATTLGAVQYASASSNSTITVCVNKKNGAMRHLSKGSCKKTETTLNWNQVGPQGIQGPQGPAGLRGEAGVATSGVNGQNLYAVDDTNRELGMITSASSDVVTVLASDGVWSWKSFKYESENEVRYFRNSNCTVPLGVIGLYTTPFTSSFKISPQSRFVVQKSTSKTPTAAYSITGQPFDIQTLTTIYEWSNISQSCAARTVSTYFTGENWAVYDLVQVALPSYTPPIRIIQR